MLRSLRDAISATNDNNGMPRREFTPLSSPRNGDKNNAARPRLVPRKRVSNTGNSNVANLEALPPNIQNQVRYLLQNERNLIPVGKPSTVRFGTGSLGLCVIDAGAKVMVTYLQPNPDGSPGQAEKSGMVQIGDQIVKVNSTSCVGMDMNQVLAVIAAYPRPLVIDFQHYEFVQPAGTSGVTHQSSSTGITQEQLNVNPAAMLRTLRNIDDIIQNKQHLVERSNPYLVQIGRGILGMKITTVNGRIVVTGFDRGVSGEMGQAEKAGQIQIGDELLAVEKYSCKGYSVHKAAELLHRTSRPTILKFVRLGVPTEGTVTVKAPKQGALGAALNSKPNNDVLSQLSKCVSCGSPGKSSAKFCWNCGAAMPIKASPKDISDSQDRNSEFRALVDEHGQRNNTIEDVQQPSQNSQHDELEEFGDFSMFENAQDSTSTKPESIPDDSLLQHNSDAHQVKDFSQASATLDLFDVDFQVTQDSSITDALNTTKLGGFDNTMLSRDGSQLSASLDLLQVGPVTTGGPDLLHASGGNAPVAQVSPKIDDGPDLLQVSPKIDDGPDLLQVDSLINESSDLLQVDESTPQVLSKVTESPDLLQVDESTPVEQAHPKVTVNPDLLQVDESTPVEQALSQVTVNPDLLQVDEITSEPQTAQNLDTLQVDSELVSPQGSVEADVIGGSPDRIVDDTQATESSDLLQVNLINNTGSLQVVGKEKSHAASNMEFEICNDTSVADASVFETGKPNPTPVGDPSDFGVISAFFSAENENRGDLITG